MIYNKSWNNSLAENVSERIDSFLVGTIQLLVASTDAASMLLPASPRLS